jgi:hypothetical protein
VKTMVGNSPRWRLCKRTDGGPPAKMAAVRSVVILKKAGNRVSPDPRWRLCKKRLRAPVQDGCRAQRNNNIKAGNS